MKKIILVSLMIASSSLIYAQYNKDKAKNIIKAKMIATMKQNPREQEIKQDESKRQAQANQHINQEITKVQKMASYLDNNFQASDYMTGPSDTDLSSFSGAQKNANKPDRLSLLEGDGAVSTPAKSSVEKNDGLGLNAIPIAQKANIEISRLESLLVLGDGDYEM